MAKGGIHHELTREELGLPEVVAMATSPQPPLSNRPKSRKDRIAEVKRRKFQLREKQRELFGDLPQIVSLGAAGRFVTPKVLANELGGSEAQILVWLQRLSVPTVPGPDGREWVAVGLLEEQLFRYLRPSMDIDEFDLWLDNLAGRMGEAKKIAIIEMVRDLRPVINGVKKRRWREKGRRRTYVNADGTPHDSAEGAHPHVGE